MGVLNVTPDSFSDGGVHLEPRRALLRALEMEREGADFIDVGGESTRPGAKPVSASEELKRVLPVLRLLTKNVKIPISVDTYKYDVASAALDHGVVLINDISGLEHDKRLAKKIARHRAGVVLMHMRGTPQTMQTMTSYKNLIKDVTAGLKKAVASALAGGIDPRSIALDPGFGFAKTFEQNFEMLARLNEFAILKKPLLVGLSRKSFIGHALNLPQTERLYGSLGAASAAAIHGAHILRVHDVRAHREMIDILDRSQEFVAS